ncbi:MAG: hypothetical protein ABIR70_15945 [Bryobacteraceae bacterium]
MRIAFLLFSLCAFGQVETPSIGSMLDASGQLRPVYGVAGNFVLGPPISDAVLDPLPNTAGAVLRLAHAAVFANDNELVLRRADASEVRFPLAGVTAFRMMSADWVQVITASGSYALRVEPNREALFALPGTARAEVRRR